VERPSARDRLLPESACASMGPSSTLGGTTSASSVTEPRGVGLSHSCAARLSAGPCASGVAAVRGTRLALIGDGDVIGLGVRRTMCELGRLCHGAHNSFRHLPASGSNRRGFHLEGSLGTAERTRSACGWHGDAWWGHIRIRTARDGTRARQSRADQSERNSKASWRIAAGRLPTTTTGAACRRHGSSPGALN